MKRFEPSRTYSSPSRRAVVRIAAESEPEPASVSAYAASTSPDASRGRKRAFCSSVPGELEPERAELLHREDEPARRADLRDLLDRDEREERPGAGAAVLLVEEEPEDAVLAVELDDVPRELVRLVDLGRARRDAVARERADELADLELLVGQRLPGHGRSLGRRVVADALDVVAVGVEDVGGVVVRVVLRAEPGRAVVAPARGDRRLVEPVDGLAIVALEGDVRAADGLAAPDPEVEPAVVGEVRERALLLVDDPVPERPSTLVERFATQSLTLTAYATSRGSGRRPRCCCRPRRGRRPVVVLVVVLEPAARCLPAGRDRGFVERVDAGVVVALERHVRAADRVAAEDAEVESAWRPRTRANSPTSNASAYPSGSSAFE